MAGKIKRGEREPRSKCWRLRIGQDVRVVGAEERMVGEGGQNQPSREQRGPR